MTKNKLKISFDIQITEHHDMLALRLPMLIGYDVYFHAHAHGKLMTFVACHTQSPKIKHCALATEGDETIPLTKTLSLCVML